MQIVFSVHDAAPTQDAQIVDEGIGAFNESAAPLHEVRPLSCFARNAAGEVLGGAVGRTWGACCELQQLWVQEAYRNHGIGARLLQDFERAAAARGCTMAYLETFSFQAPDWYARRGYAKRLELRGFGNDHRIVKYIMVRELV